MRQPKSLPEGTPNTHFSGYHQIKMAVEDVEKTAFLTPCGVYCYTCIPFGLRNAGATFQRLMHITLGPQLGKNVEAYVHDIVVKSREAKTWRKPSQASTL